MRKRWWVVFAAAALAVTAGAVAANDLNFGTHLKGRYEVPMRATNAQGQAIFRVADDGQSIDYTLIASNIENAFMAHIHMTPVGVDPTTNNGGIVVWLYPSTAPVQGPLGSGRHAIGPARRDRVRSHVRQRAHARRGRRDEHRPGRLPRRRDPRPARELSPR